MVTQLRLLMRVTHRICTSKWHKMQKQLGMSNELVHWLVRNEQQNKSYAYDHEVPQSKKAMLRYRVIGRGDRYDLLEVELMTGRHHQIRCQLSKIGCPIRGDLKYGARRSNPDGSISLLSHRVEFVHPVSHQIIKIEAPIQGHYLCRGSVACRLALACPGSAAGNGHGQGLERVADGEVEGVHVAKARNVEIARLRGFVRQVQA